MSSTYPDLQYTSFPDSIQQFATMLDIDISDASAVAGYQAAMRNGDYATAQSYYNQIVNGDQKILDAIKLNKLLDTCISLQKFYATDIEPYINEKQEYWDTVFGQFKYLGDYSASQNYFQNNFVTFNLNGVTQVFICLKYAPAGTSITNVVYWRQLTIRGLQGESGDNLSFRFMWSSAEVYYINDVVNYNGNLWCCLAQNSNQTPRANSSYWRFIRTQNQDIYPFSSTQPTGQAIGSLWFQILS